MFLGGNKPSRTADLRGDISVNFSCDPEISSKLVRSLFSHNPTTLYLSVIAAIWFYQSHLFVFQVDLALEEIVRLQEEGPSQEDISAILEIEQRAHENGLQVCFFLFFCPIIHSYKYITANKIYFIEETKRFSFSVLFRKTITG